MSDHLSLYLAAVLSVVLQDVVSFRYEIDIKTVPGEYNGYRHSSFIKIFGSGYLKTAEHQMLLKDNNVFFKHGSTTTLTITDEINVEDICGVTIRTAHTEKWCIQKVTAKNVHRNKAKAFEFGKFGRCISKSSTTTFLNDKGEWIEWGKWSNCDGTCGIMSNKTRVRHCVYPGTRCRNNICTGSSIQTQMCAEPVYCKVEWTGWSDWSGCEGACGANTKQKRKRFCITFYDNLTCDGPMEEEQNCTTQSYCQSCPKLSSTTTDASKSSTTTETAQSSGGVNATEGIKSSNSTGAPKLSGGVKPCPLVNGPQKDYVSRGISLGVLLGLSLLINIVLVAFLVVVLKDFCRKKKDSGEDVDEGETHARPVPYDETVYNN